MGRGDSKKVSDERILLEMLINPDPGVYASEIAEQVDLTRPRVDGRLKDLEDEGLVHLKEASNRNLWWLTPEGGDRVKSAAREAIESWDRG
jgi:predicted transcriptional regulator